MVTASEGVVDVVSEASATTKQLAERSGSEEKWLRLFGDITEILNRGGDVGENLLEARARLSEEMKLLAAPQHTSS